LPPNPPLRYDEELIALLSRADHAVGQLDGVSGMLPNPDLFVAMYVRREAVLSSQIEGTRSSLDDVLAFELDPRTRADLPLDVEDVVNYVRSLNYGLERLATLPLSLRLIRELHGELMQGMLGIDKRPGEFRTSQNWIGPANAPLSEAIYVPPPPTEMWQALDNFEKFLHDDRLPTLVHCGIAHSQFEMIHPFLDGNGRVGRLLIALLLCHRGMLRLPLLYLSLYLKRNQQRYYARLMGVHEDGDWEGWLRFFLLGVVETAQEATATADAIVRMRDQHAALVQGLGKNAHRLLDLLFEQPLADANYVKDRLGVTFKTASALLARLAEIGIVDETTGGQRYRKFRYAPYLELFADQAPPTARGVTAEIVIAGEST
jgi:Fic family protein